MGKRIGLLAGGIAALLIVWRGGAQDLEAAPPLRVAASSDAQAPSPVKATAKAASVADALLIGDASLRGAIDLSRAVERDGHLEVPLGKGRKAVLTLDPALQRAAESVLERAKAPYGAVVVMATDGRILALAGRSNAEGKDRDPALALKVWAPAASIFKIVTAAALVSAGVEPTRKVCYHGGLRSIETSNLTDDPRRDNDCQDLAFGLAKSQNAIIAKLVHRHLSPKKLAATAEKLGFHREPVFALAAEAARAVIPDARDVEFARVAAGFWHTEMSPLGGAILANTIAAGGLEVTPRIVAEIVEKDGAQRPVVAVAPERVLDEKVAARVADMMIGTCDYGTARTGFFDPRGRRFMSDVKVAGKTGSLTRTDPDYLAYSWFVGFAPADAPQVSISVLLGNPPKWYLKAHTAARLVLDELF